MSSRNVMTLGDLREILSHFSDDDLVVMETTDLDTGDAIDLFPFYIDEIDGIDIRNEKGEIVNRVSEIRFCQMDNKIDENGTVGDCFPDLSNDSSPMNHY